MNVLVQVAMVIALILAEGGLSLRCLAQTSEQLSACIRDVDGGDAEQVIQNCSQAIDSRQLTEQNMGRALNNRGIAYQNKGDYDRAIADFTRTLDLNPNDDKAFNNRGAAFMQRRDWDHAIADFTQALRLHPDYAIAHKNRGASRLNEGRFAEAIEDYDRALQLDPKDTEALKSRGALHFMLGQFAMAAQDLAQDIALDPDDTYSAIWLYLAQARSGSSGKAALAKSTALPGVEGWPAAIEQTFLGKVTPAELTRLARDSGPDPDKDRECELNFYLGEQALLASRRAEAAKLFRAALDTQAKDNLEYKAAGAELQRLAKR